MEKLRFRNMSKRAWLEIDTKTIAHNFSVINETTGSVDVMAVLKANAYGIGIKQIVPIVESAGATRIGVASLHEAITARQYTSLPIQIMSNSFTRRNRRNSRAGIHLSNRKQTRS